MPVLPPPSSPKQAFGDIRAFFTNRDRGHVIGLLLATLCTGFVVVLFFVDSTVNTAPPPETIYVESWSANRSDEVIIAQQKKDQAAREKAMKARQEEFKKLQDQLGIE